VGSGNEGNSGGHLAGSLLQENNVASVGGRPGPGTAAPSGDGVPSRIGPIARPVSVELAVADYERTLNVQLWKNYCDTYRIFLRSPGGQETQLPRMVNGGKYTLRLEQTEIMIYFGEPAPYAVAEEIYFEMLPLGQNYINSGVWTIRLEPLQVVTGRYYFYLPSAAVRAAGTGFYHSTPEVTLTIPSTAAKVISVGAYDSTYEAYADFSGRGYADANRTIGVVAAGLADKCQVQLAYAIGVARPVSVRVDTFGTGSVGDEALEAAVDKVFDLRPTAIINRLDLRRPIYRQTAAYGHFGRPELELPWEKTDMVDAIKAAL